MRFIARQDIDALGIDIPALAEALAGAFRASSAGEIAMRPKSTVNQPDGAFLIGSLAAWPQRRLGIFHSVLGAPPANLAPGEAHYRSYQLVTDYDRGTARALIDGSFTSTMLPAGVTALSAGALARPDSSVVTLIGAGLQARVNLAALRTRLPIREVRILGRSSANAEALAREVVAGGLEAKVMTDAREAVGGADIIVSTVPGGPALVPFLDPAWVSPGAFVSAVDLGRSWTDGFEAFDRIVSDDRVQARVQHSEGRVRYGGDYDSELPELVTGRRPPRQAADDRIVLIHPGNIVGVLAISALILDRLPPA
jgi:ornithine cyclodeaminase/alanine dehydrogenase-like protein (mu-crystallin family)